jgi:C1A family cysteine protease
MLKSLYTLLILSVLSACGYVVIRNEPIPSGRNPLPEREESEEDYLYPTGLVHPPAGWEETAVFDGPAQTMEALPEAYDWNDYGHLQPIRNQKSCGSCWSFSTMATVESVRRLVQPMDSFLDLSEQDVLACSGAGSCRGGFFNALDYFTKGVAMEKDLPYTARDSSCKSSLSRRPMITAWKYIGERGKNPTTDQIKAAIYKHGPVSVDVNGSGSFQSYKKGVFTSCGSSSTNHMTNIEGWQDDANYAGGGYWLMRNSWGSSWGDNGYMKIAYKARNGSNCNGIGNYAAYVVVDDIQDLQEYLGLK